MKTINLLKADLWALYLAFKAQDFAFWMAAFYLVFAYLKPQVTFPIIDFLPWTQLSILAGLGYLIVKGRISLNIVHVAMIIFFIIVIVSIYDAVYPEIGWRRFDVIYIQLIELIFFTNCIKNMQQFKLIITIFFLILLKMSLFGAKTWVSRGFGFTSWGIAGPDGYFANSGEFSLLMAMFAIMSLGFIAGHATKRKIYYIAPITAVMTVLGASSRGSQLAIAAGLLVMAFVMGKLSLKNILIFALIGTLGYNLMPEEQMKRFESMGEDDTSQSRLKYWESGVKMMNDNKLTGVGYFGFAEYYHNYYKEGIQSGYLANRREVAHNSLVETGSELGYPGLLCYIWFHILCFNMNNRCRRMARASNRADLNWIPLFSTGLNVTLLVYFIGAFFMSVAYYPYIYIMMMFSQSLYSAMLKETDKK